MAPALADVVSEPPVHLAVKGDWGHGTSAQAAVSRRICAEHRRTPFAAVLTTGDNFSDPAGTATDTNFHAPERCILALGIPYRPAWGNHDLAGTATADMLGAPRRFYAFTAGPARVVVLDANDPADPDQLSFLRREMAAPASGPRIVAFHQPLRSAGYHRPDAEQARLWDPLLRDGGVTLVLQGHNHHYERIEDDGLTYVTTGGGGAPVYPCVFPARGLTACRWAHHFVSLSVTRRGLDLRAVTPDGRELDRAHIPARRDG